MPVTDVALCATCIAPAAPDARISGTGDNSLLIEWDAVADATAYQIYRNSTGCSDQCLPDSFELIRGKTARLQGNLQSLHVMVKGLPLTYNRDLQEDKLPVFDTFDQLAICLEVAAGSLQGMVFNLDRCAAAVADPALLATDLADFLVEQGVAFRDAHHAVGALVHAAEVDDLPLDQVSDARAAAIHPELKGEWRQVFDLKTAMSKRRGIGMPGPVRVAGEIRRWRRTLGAG